MTENKQLYLTTEPLKLFFKAAIPGAISMLAASLFSLFDGMFVGQILGDTAFAAINLAMPLVIVNFALADLIGVGSSVPISIHLGKGENNKANNYFSCACILIVLTGLLMGVLLYVGAEPIMTFMRAEGELKQMAADYLKVYAICSPISTMTFAADNFLRICGKLKMSMLLNIFNSLLTIVLEFICLFILDMPVWGAALASCTAMISCVVIAMMPLAMGKLSLRFCRPHFTRGLLRQIVSSGSPTFLSNAAARITNIVMNMALIHMGGSAAVTIFGVVMYGGDLIQPIIYGVCDSMQPAIGYNHGAGNVVRVKRFERYVLIASAAVSALSLVVMMGIPELVASLFLQPHELDLLERSAHAIRLYSLSFVTRWFGFSIQSLFTALDKPLPATVLSVGNALVFPMISIAALWSLGLDGLWLNFPVTSALVALTAGLLLLLLRKTLFCPRKE